MLNCCGGNVEVGWDPDAFYATKPECADEVPMTHFKPRSGKTLSARRWHASFSEDGHLDIAKVLSRIQRGGIYPTIKGSVWEFLLGCYDPKSTFDERTRLRQQRRSEYDTLKTKCKEMEPTIGSGRLLTMPVITEDGHPIEYPSSDGVTSQENTQSHEASSPMPERQTDNVVKDEDILQWKLTLHQIGLDVVRTDRTLVYYENEENRARLSDILAVYSWIDKDIGYCQGMSDLCSPISMLVENEADAFWCFERLMCRVRENFKCTSTSIGVSSQLTVLASIIKAVDPKLHEHIENLDGGEYLFAFRMLMVLFRREYSFVDTLYLWEPVNYNHHGEKTEIRRVFDFLNSQLMWAMEYNPNVFSLYESKTEVDQNMDNLGNKKEYGKFERKIVKTGQKNQQSPLSIFLVASLLEAKNKRLLVEAKGLDDVVKILNDITGNLDAKKACNNALKLHKKYLSMVQVS